MDLTRLLSGFALGMLIASQVTRLHAQGGLAADGWSGQVQCVLRAQTPGYEDVQTHTWVLSGAAPIARANFRDYPATWTVSGNGSRTPLPGLPGGAGGASTDTWTRSGSDANAYLTIFEPIGTRNLRIAPGQIPLRASAGLAVTTAVRVPGGATTPISSSSFDSDEWRFPYIDAVPTAGTMSGSRTQARVALVGWRQPAGAPVTETCTWNFAQGRAAPASGSLSRATVPSRVPGTLRGGTTVDSPTAGTSPPPASQDPAPTVTAGVLDNPGGAANQAPPEPDPVRERPPALTSRTVPSPPPSGGGTPANSSPASLVGATVAECARPGPPELVADATPAHAYLKWNAAPGATGYTVARNGLGTVTSSALTATEFTHEAVLDSRGPYEYSVTAIYPQGCGTSSVAVTPTPQTPTQVHVATGAGNAQARTGRVTLTWRLPRSANGRDDLTGLLVLGPGAAQGIEVSKARSGNAYSLDLDDVPAGEHSWQIEGVWDTAAGRSFGADRGVRVSARVGFFRVLINGLTANATTVDDPFDIDGRGDEIYVGVAAYIGGEMVGNVKSAVHGDVGPAPPLPPAPPGIVMPTRDNRVRAGSSSNGGILDRDTVPAGDPSVISGAPSATTFPLLVWEGWLGGDTEVLVNPSVWEYDGDLSAYNEWQQLMINTHPTKSARPGSESSAREPLNETELDTREKDDDDADREQREREVEDQLQSTLRQQLRVEAVIIRGGQTLDDVVDDRPDLYETPDTTAMQMIPIQTAPSRDRYIGTISRTPALRLSSGTPAAARGLVFKDEQFTIADLRAVPLRGDYQIYIAIVPVP